MEKPKIKPGYYWVMGKGNSRGIYERSGDAWCFLGHKDKLFEDEEAVSHIPIPDPETCLKLARLEKLDKQWMADRIMELEKQVREMTAYINDISIGEDDLK